MDIITISNLKIYAHHGVYQEEKETGQNFYVNAKLYLDMEKAAKTDAVSDSVHYGEVCEKIHSFLTEHRFQLLETAVTETIRHILLCFPLLSGMEMELCKPEAPIELPFENVSVTRSLFWHTVYLALGSNMGNTKEYLDGAVKKLADDNNFRDITVSDWITTKPYGGVKQDDFLNGVLGCKTMLSPNALLDRIHEIEQQADRKREIHWGPRTLDLDILFYDDLILDTEKLTIPHPDMQNRQFVLAPMSEIAPYFRHPLTKRTIVQMLADLQNNQSDMGKL